MRDYSGRNLLARSGRFGKAWCVIAAMLFVSCDRSQPTTSQAPKEHRAPAKAAKASPAAEQLPEPSALPDGVWRGACFAHNWQLLGRRGYGSEASAEALDHLRSVGVDWISVTPFGFMPDLNAPRVEGEHSDRTHPAGESRERLREVVEQARSRDMRIMLKPHIWIRGGKWRGRIKPLDDDGELVWKRWWDSHDEWILYYARFAAEHGIESLVIGLELHTAVQAHPERLVQLAEKVREVYDGHLTYSANWNEPVPLKVWAAMDSVGVQFYPPLVDKRNSRSLDEIRQSMRQHLDDWNEVARKVSKPLVITEVGYRSADLAVRHPNAWPEKHKADVDEELQALAYQVFFDELGQTPALGGVFLWKYFTDKTTDEEGPTGFSPRGKPAEAVIRRAFQDVADENSVE